MKLELKVVAPVAIPTYVHVSSEEVEEINSSSQIQRYNTIEIPVHHLSREQAEQVAEDLKAEYLRFYELECDRVRKNAEIKRIHES